MVKTIMWKTKGKAKERPKDAWPAITKKEKTLVPLMVGSTHNLFHVASMQIVNSNNNKRPKTSISWQPIFLFIVEAKHIEK